MWVYRESSTMQLCCPVMRTIHDQFLHGPQLVKRHPLSRYYTFHRIDYNLVIGNRFFSHETRSTSSTFGGILPTSLFLIENLVQNLSVWWSNMFYVHRWKMLHVLDIYTNSMHAQFFLWDFFVKSIHNVNKSSAV